MPGLQRLAIQNDGVVIIEGDGRAIFYSIASTGGLTKPAGEFSTLMYASPEYHRTYPDGTKAVFTAAGVLSYVEDRFGRRTTFGYSSGRLSTITDPIGKQFTLGYNGSGKLASITDPGSRITSTTVNSSGDLVQINGPDNVMAFGGTYDDHRLRTRTDERNKTWGYAYDFSGRLAADTLPAVVASGSNVRPVVGYVAWESAALVSTCTCNRPHINGDTLRAKVIDPLGNTTKLSFDRFFGATRVEAPLGHTTVIDRSTHGLPERVIEPSGATRTYGWNVNGALEVVQQPETSQSVNIKYHWTWKTDPTTVSVGASETIYSYGTTGQLLSVRVNQDSTRYEYDTLWRTKKIVDPENHTTTYTYQTGGLQNLASVSEMSSSGSSRVTTFGYDGFGRTTGVSDDAGTTSYLYDVLDRITRVTDPTNRATNYAYDGMYVLTVTDAASKVYRFNRNAAGWVESEVDPNSRYTYYRYDRAGNLIGMKNREQNEITMVPDALGRVVSRTADGATTTYAYDNPAGRWVAAANALSTDTVFYDERGRIKREVSKVDGRLYEVNSGYLAEGPRDTMRFVAPTWNRTVAFAHNNALQLTGINQLVAGVIKQTSVLYNKDGLPSQITYPTSTSRQHTLTYTASHMPQQNGGLASVAYAYDTVERLTKRTSAAGDSARIFAYNARDELTSLRDEEYSEEWVCPTLEPMDCYWEQQTTIVGSRSYSYDVVGNRTDSGATLQSGSNRYQTFNGYTFEYDLDGNVLRKYKSGFDQYFTWNTLGQLTQVTTNGVAVSYGYNGFGERVYRAGSDTRYYVYDADDLLLEVDASGNRLREYTHFPGIDQPLSMLDASGAIFYYTPDYPGHVAGLYNSSGSLVNQYRYSPWGEPETTSEGIANTLRYMARELDPQTGVYYVRNRWYDAAIGRFLSEDPIGLNGGINLYAYVGNSPTNYTDPLGLDYDSTCEAGAFSVTFEGNSPNATWTCTRFRWVGNTGRGTGFGGNFGPTRDFANLPGPTSGDGVHGTSGEDAYDDCKQARMLAAGAVLLDVVGVATGVGLGFRLVQASAMRAGALRLAAQGMWNYGARGSYTLAVAQRNAAIAGARGMFLGPTGLLPTDVGYTAAAGALSGSSSLWDFVPVVGSIRAIRAAGEACK